MLVVTAILLPFILLFAAIAIDVGYWWVNAKKAQIAADACALAAARELPQNWDPPRTECVFEGIDYAKENLPLEGLANEPRHLGTAVKSPYPAEKGGDPARYVEAKVTVAVRTFFGRIIGYDYVTITRRAVAEKLEGTAKMAIFVGSTDCAKGLLINGKDINVTGHVHSNGQYKVNSAASPDHAQFTSGTIAKENCVAEVNPTGPPPEAAGAQYGGGDEWLPQDGLELQWPTWYYPADFGFYLPAVQPAQPGRCTYKGNRIEFNNTHLLVDGVTILAHNKRIPSGTYCSTNEFIINADDMCMPATAPPCTFTALAPKIAVGGNGQNYAPYFADMLLYTIPNSNDTASDDGPFTLGNFNPANIPPYPPCSPSPAADTGLDGINYHWAGIIFNPCGRVKINNHDTFAGSPQLVGTVYGFEVEINGDGFNMVGTEEFDDSAAIFLVE